MSELSSAERVLRVLRRQEPDRIPHFEWIIDRAVREAICPGCTMEEFTLRMGLDAILTAPDFRKERVGATRWRNEWGMLSEESGEEHSVPLEGPIQTREDLRQYQPPDLQAPGRYASLERLVQRYKGKLAIGVHLNDVFSLPRNLMGFENLLLAFAEQPVLVRELVALSVAANLEMAQEVARRGADFVFTGDDYASCQGPLISPSMFREFLLPGLKQLFGGIHALGLPIIKHSDGNLMPLLGMILESGIDCLDPIEPRAGMDLAALKQAYGQRLAFKGNVDCAHTLSFGSERQVVDETRQAIRAAAAGGGLILSSSNSIHSGVRPGNYLAMWNAIRIYGTYPIRLDGWDDSSAGAAFS
jgi:uroporphyrinogen decarboxylase